MKEAGVAGQIERFANLPDPRVEGRTDHDLLDIVVSSHETWTRGMAGSKPVVAWRSKNWTGWTCSASKARWPKIASVACIESTREMAGRIETEKRYVISSLPADSRRILHAVRTNWGIENKLHWCLDVTFGEDASSFRLRNAALNFSFLRRVAMNLFRADKSRSLSLHRKIKTAT